MKYITQISRIFVGVLFILSGFIKANDTIGFSYKLVEYFEIFNMHFFVDYAVGMAMFICIFEIIVGVALLLGAYNTLNIWLLLLMIIFFTILTGYSAITNKVTDCGCFGDAVKLKPVESFLKDVVLLVLILILYFGKQHIKPIFNKTVTGITIGTSLLITTFFTFNTYMFLPLIDFLPYKVGNDIQEKMTLPPNAKKDSVVMLFVYEKNGQKFEFTMDEIANVDTTYTYVDRIDKMIVKGDEPPIHDFRLFDAGGVDYTDSLLNQKGFRLIVVQTYLPKSRNGIEKQLAELSNLSIAAGVPVWGLTNTNLAEVEPYRHEFQLPIKYYNMDATPLKSMVRSNPGIILMKNNVVIKKWSAYGIPTFEQVKLYMEGKVGRRGIRPKDA
ncbi:MAG: DoxX family protein [Bacteroidia bacterium]|jgi:uncharacterized membrane protein YphA (DoxX/SURF4 family)|nr:DoxX family protein [Bacteroidia bacterium]